MNVELILPLVDAVDRALVHTGSVLNTYAGFTDYVGH
jgi:hypothetical protein